MPLKLMWLEWEKPPYELTPEQYRLAVFVAHVIPELISTDGPANSR